MNAVSKLEIYDHVEAKYEMPGKFLSKLIDRSMKEGDVETFKVCFEALGNNPEVINLEGENLWMCWCKVKDSLESKGSKVNKEIELFLLRHHANDVEFLLQLYARGGVEALIIVATTSTKVNINSRDSAGLRILDRIALPTHLGDVLGEQVSCCTEEDVMRLRNVGYRFGRGTTEQYDTIWCRANKKEKAVYWDLCVRDAKELGLFDEDTYRLWWEYYGDIWIARPLQYANDDPDFVPDEDYAIREFLTGSEDPRQNRKGIPFDDFLLPGLDDLCAVSCPVSLKQLQEQVGIITEWEVNVWR